MFISENDKSINLNKKKKKTTNCFNVMCAECETFSWSLLTYAKRKKNQIYLYTIWLFYMFKFH